MMNDLSCFTNFTQIISFHSFSLFFKRYTARQLYGKPPTLLRDSGSKNPLFFSKSTFFIKKKIWSYMISQILRCAHFSLKSAILGEKNSKKFLRRTLPQNLQKMAKLSLYVIQDRKMIKNPHFFSKSAFFIKKKDNLIRSHRS